MDKTEKLIDWEENEKKDRNRNGLDDRIEPPIPDVSAGSKKLSIEPQCRNSGPVPCRAPRACPPGLAVTSAIAVNMVKARFIARLLYPLDEGSRLSRGVRPRH